MAFLLLLLVDAVFAQVFRIHCVDNWWIPMHATKITLEICNSRALSLTLYLFTAHTIRHFLLLLLLLLYDAYIYIICVHTFSLPNCHGAMIYCGEMQNEKYNKELRAFFAHCNCYYYSRLPPGNLKCFLIHGKRSNQSVKNMLVELFNWFLAILPIAETCKERKRRNDYFLFKNKTNETIIF